MQLVHLNIETTPPTRIGRQGIPRVSFSRGAIWLNEKACELLSIKEGSKVAFTYDTNEPNNWYVYVDAEKGFDVKTSEARKGFGFTNASLFLSLCKVTGKEDDKTHPFLIAGLPTDFKDKRKYFGILIPE